MYGFISLCSGVVYTVEPLDHETSEKFMFWINVTDKTYVSNKTWVSVCVCVCMCVCVCICVYACMFVCVGGHGNN